jgi:phosphatidylglycerophosphate synthase
VWLGVGVGLAALTDVLDGIIARRSRGGTARGSRLDAIADHLLTASTAIWLVWLRPGFVAAELPLLLAWLALAATALVAAWVKFRRVVDLHLYSAKVAGTLGYLFAIWLLLVGTYSARVFHLVVGAGLFSAAESLLVVLTRDAVDEHIGTVLRRSAGAGRVGDAGAPGMDVAGSGERRRSVAVSAPDPQRSGDVKETTHVRRSDSAS